MTISAEQVVERFIAARIEPGRTVEQGNLRIHRFVGSIHLWDLTHAGKRGKKVEHVILLPKGLGYREAEAFLSRLSMMLEDLNSFARALATVKDYLVDNPDDLTIITDFERGVDVKPAGFKKLVITTPHVHIEVEHTDFRIQNLDDKFNEPTCIPSAKGGVAGIPTLYRWVQDNKTALKKMKYRDILNELSKMGISYHDYCAMD